MEKIHVISDDQFKLVGQLVYEPGEGLAGVGIRVYRGVDPKHNEQEFLCLEDAESGDEAWYRIEGNRPQPVSLEGLEQLPRNPR